MKKVLALITVMGMVMSLAACGGSQGGGTPPSGGSTGGTSDPPKDSGETYVLKISTEQAASEPFGQLVTMLGERIEEKTNGRIDCEVYYNSELANAVDACASIQQGANILTFASFDFYSSYVQDLAMLDGPFFFYSPEELEVLQQSDWWAEQMEKLKELNIGNNGALYFGARSIIHKVKDGTAPKDFAGVLMRSATTEMRYAMCEAMTGNVTSVGWSEIYQALSTGVAEMCEAPLGSIQSTKIYEVCPYITLTEHILSYNSIWYAQSWYESLPADVQAGFDAACAELQAESIDYIEAADAEIRADLESKGVTFYERSSAEEWAEATRSAYDVINWTEGAYERCQEILGH